MVKITVLHNELKNFNDLKSGFSLLITLNNKKILFDTSYFNQVKKNSEIGKINLNNIDYLILSHGHIDHTDGLNHINLLKIKTLLAHPNCFSKRYFPGEGQIGIPIELNNIKQKTTVVATRNPFWIGENKTIVFLGEIPRVNDFEGKEIIGKLENGEHDFVADDSAIAIKSNNGLIIISGCSHSGICNIIEYAKKVCSDNRIYAVIGGFHLFNKTQINRTILFFKSQNIKNLFPMHCLSQYAFSGLKKIGAVRVHTLQEITL